MNNEEAVKILKWLLYDDGNIRNEETEQALKIDRALECAIDVLEKQDTIFEKSDKNKTLFVNVPKNVSAAGISRVILLEPESHFCGVYYCGEN